ncbi:MAG: hypothetical protein RSC24_06705 [Clostridium sp.]
MLKQVKLDIDANKQTQKKFTTKFTKEDVQRYLEDPKKYDDKLRDVTKALCVLSPQFNRLVGYIPDMAMFNYVIIPKLDKVNVSNKEKYVKEYQKWGNYLENLNIQHEFSKIIKSNFKFDAYYGYILEEKDSFYIRTLNNDYCKITSVDDGCFSYSFNFEFFDKDSNKQYLKYYPSEFKEKYEKYKDKGIKYKWQELNSNNTICTKFYEDLIDISYPPYCNTFNDLYDISDYKQIDKQGAENENYQLIGLEMETNDKDGKPNNFTVDPQTALNYYQLIHNSLPPGIGAFLSPLPWKTANFNSTGQSKSDRVQNSTRNFWDGAGVSSVLFSSGANNAGTLKYSMLVDTNMLFVIYRQLERWLNRKLKRAFNGRVSIKLLDIHRLNQSDFIDQNLKLAQYGIPNKTVLASAIGLSPIEMLSLNTLECDVLDLVNNLKPLSSSHTQSGSSGESGRPQSDEGDLKESGEQTRKNSSNDNKV